MSILCECETKSKNGRRIERNFNLVGSLWERWKFCDKTNNTKFKYSKIISRRSHNHFNSKGNSQFSKLVNICMRSTRIQLKFGKEEFHQNFPSTLARNFHHTFFFHWNHNWAELELEIILKFPISKRRNIWALNTTWWEYLCKLFSN